MLIYIVTDYQLAPVVSKGLIPTQTAVRAQIQYLTGNGMGSLVE